MENLNEASDELAEKFTFKKQMSSDKVRKLPKREAQKLVLFDFSLESEIITINPVRESKRKPKSNSTAVAASK